jgi:DNA-binding transcriptional ArsR family regulator
MCDLVCVDERKVRKVRRELGHETDHFRLAELFKAFADPTRVKILRALAVSELCVCDIAALVGLTQSAVSHQLRFLRVSRLVKYRKDGKMAYYSLDDEHVRLLLDQGLRHVRESR